MMKTNDCIIVCETTVRRFMETSTLPHPELMMMPMTSSGGYLVPSADDIDNNARDNTYENDVPDDTYESLQEDRRRAATDDYEPLQDDGDNSNEEEDIAPNPPLPRPELPAPH